MIEKYQKTLGEIPEFLYKYLEDIERLKYISYFCGMDYCGLYNFKNYYSRYDHSVSTAIMTYKFTKSKTQTIASLFHDISTPAFSHVIDYMNNDKIKQESTEEKHKEFILNSKSILEKLKQDNINVEDILNPKKFNIVDNNIPNLCTDRLDSTFVSNLIWFETINLEDVKEIYNDITIIDNEIVFKSKDIAKKTFDLALNVGYETNSNYDKLALQLMADIIKLAIGYNIICEDVLYLYSEKDILNIIEKSDIKEIKSLYNTFKNMKKIKEEDEILKFDKNSYYVSFDVKKRYIDPKYLEKDNIIILSKDEEANTLIKEYKNYKTKKYAYVKKW